jgi:hypothetical protein
MEEIEVRRAGTVKKVKVIKSENKNRPGQGEMKFKNMGEFEMCGGCGQSG